MRSRRSGRSPRRIVIDSHNPAFEGLDFSQPVLPQIMDWLYKERCQSLIVEGGLATLQSFLDAGLWDEIRVETAPMTVTDGTRAPELPSGIKLVSQKDYDGNVIRTYCSGI